MPPVASPETTCWRKISIGSVSEIRASDGVVPAELGGRARHDDAAGLEEVGMVRQVERRRHVLLDEQDADALLAVDRTDDAEDLADDERSEEHTSELQSRPHLVCRLLLEKKKRPAEPRHALLRRSAEGP